MSPGKISQDTSTKVNLNIARRPEYAPTPRLGKVIPHVPLVTDLHPTASFRVQVRASKPVAFPGETLLTVYIHSGGKFR
jgi:hypothetical protein